MTNQPNKATVKDGLPTAEEILSKHFLCDPNNQPLDEVYVGETTAIYSAMQEYSNQQAAELDKMAEQLSAENSHLSSIIEGLKIDKEWLRERVFTLQAKIASYESAIDGLKKVVDSLYNLKS